MPIVKLPNAISLILPLSTDASHSPGSWCIQTASTKMYMPRIDWRRVLTSSHERIAIKLHATMIFGSRKTSCLGIVMQMEHLRGFLGKLDLSRSHQTTQAARFQIPKHHPKERKIHSTVFNLWLTTWFLTLLIPCEASQPLRHIRSLSGWYHQHRDIR